MNQLKITITDIHLKQDKETDSLQPYVKAIVEVEDEHTAIEYTNGILVNEKLKDRNALVMSNSLRRVVKNLLAVYCAGLLAKNTLTATMVTDDCEVSDCRLEE